LNNPNDDGFLSVYTLSLPGFRWFKSNESTPVRRANHYCQIIGSTASNGNSQMLSIGGRQPSSYLSLGAAPDPWTNGLAVFDMNAFSWAELYNATAGPYVQPSVIKEYYNNDYQKPTFSDAALAKAFAYTPPAKSSSTSIASPVPTGSSGGTLNTGAIVGGIVGGVAFFVIIAIIAFFVMRRRGAKSAANRAQYQHPNDQRLIVHEAPPNQVDYRGSVMEKDGSARSELPNTLATAELTGDQNVMGFQRKPVGGSLGHVSELPGS